MVVEINQFFRRSQSLGRQKQDDESRKNAHFEANSRARLSSDRSYLLRLILLTLVIDREVSRVPFRIDEEVVSN